MPRRERPLDPADDALSQFAQGLRDLREKAGSPTYRELARRAHYAAGTLSDAAGGRKLPTLPVTLAYVRACAGDVAEWEKTWHAVAAELAAEQSEPGERESAENAPYVGLGAFRVEDAYRFFGRERVLDELDSKLISHRFLAVFGPSGAGKSSLLRAGFVPRRRDAAVVLFSPGPDPFEECALQLASLLGTTAAQVLEELKASADHLRLLLRQAGQGRGTVVVVDQFEELFTVCADAGERTAFLDALLAASSVAEVVVGVRADFYSRCAEHRGLADAVSESQLLLGPMTAAELREAIVKPATRAGLSVEGALVTELVAEAHAKPGVLPLLSHALLETWHRRRGTTLALSGYHATGGIRGALAKTAEAEYSALDQSERSIAQQLFLRLIEPDEDTIATKRRVHRDELDDDPRVDAVLNRLAASRLITLDASTVELTHEALIDAWPRLRGWLADNRAGLRVHRQLTDATAAWEDSNREPDALVRGTRLEVVREWAETGRATMTLRERQFLDASLDAERAAQRRAGRRTRQLRWLAAGLAFLLVCTIVMAWDAWRSQQTADEQRQIAISRQFAAQSDAAAGQDPGLAMRLSLQAMGTSATTEARSSLLTLAGRPASDGLIPASAIALSTDGQRLVAPATGNAVAVWDIPRREQVTLLQDASSAAVNPPGPATAAAFSPDRSRLVTANSNNYLVLWDLSGKGRAINAVAGPSRFTAVAFSPDGSRIATVDSHQALQIRDSTTLQVLVAAPGVSTVEGAASVAYSSDGRTLATTSGRDQVVLRDADIGAVQATLPSSPYSSRPLAFSREGDLLAVPDLAGGIALWNVRSREIAATVRDVGLVKGLAFDHSNGNLFALENDTVTVWNRDLTWSVKLASTQASALGAGGGTIVAATNTGTLIWDSGKLPILTFAHLDDIVFDTSGTAVLGAGAGDTPARRWPVAGPHTVGEPLAAVRPETVEQRISRDGSKLVTALASGDIVVDHLAHGAPPQTFKGPGGSPGNDLALSPDGKVVAANFTGKHGTDTYTHLAVRDTTAGDRARNFAFAHRHMAFSPNNRLLAATEVDQPGQDSRGGQLAGIGDVVVQDVTTGDEIAKFDVQDADPLAHKRQVSALAYSPDGRLLAAAVSDGTVILWDTTSTTRVATVTGHTGGDRVLAFSPSGRFLAAGGDDGAILIWDLATKDIWATLGGNSAITAIAWNSSETMLAAARMEGVLDVWPIDTSVATRRLCETLAADFPAARTPTPQVCTAPG